MLYELKFVANGIANKKMIRCTDVYSSDRLFKAATLLYFDGHHLGKSLIVY